MPSPMKLRPYGGTKMHLLSLLLLLSLIIHDHVYFSSWKNDR